METAHHPEECNGIKKFTSYADILRMRVLRPLPGESLSCEPQALAWCKEKVTSSDQIVETTHASIETTMMHMAACGKLFRCIRCYLPIEVLPQAVEVAVAGPTRTFHYSQ